MIDQALWLTLAIYMEARGCDPVIQTKVGHVVLNRTVKRKMSIQDVITQDKQFSWFNKGNFPKIKNFYAFVECAESARKCLEQQMLGYFFDGADHFYSDDIPQPKWAKKMKLVEKAGPFYFYK